MTKQKLLSKSHYHSSQYLLHNHVLRSNLLLPAAPPARIKQTTCFTLDPALLIVCSQKWTTPNYTPAADLTWHFHVLWNCQKQRTLIIIIHVYQFLTVHRIYHQKWKYPIELSLNSAVKNAWVSLKAMHMSTATRRYARTTENDLIQAVIKLQFDWIFCLRKAFMWRHFICQVETLAFNPQQIIQEFKE